MLGDVYKRQTEIDTDGLQPATDRNRFRAVGWLSNLEARGGTEMDQPLAQAAGWLSRSGDRDPIIVLVTDGQVAGEDMLLRQLAEASGDRMPRVFAVGIDQAVNAGFLRRLTDLGGGVCELVESEDRLDEVMDRIARQTESYHWHTGLPFPSAPGPEDSNIPFGDAVANAAAKPTTLFHKNLVAAPKPDAFRATSLR